MKKAIVLCSLMVALVAQASQWTHGDPGFSSIVVCNATGGAVCISGDEDPDTVYWTVQPGETTIHCYFSGLRIGIWKDGLPLWYPSQRGPFDTGHTYRLCVGGSWEQGVIMDVTPVEVFESGSETINAQTKSAWYGAFGAGAILALALAFVMRGLS